MPRHLVCLTFDFDALSSWIYRKSTTPTQLSRGEFALVGAERYPLLDARGIKATWFVPGHTLETFPEACARIHAAGHEIGHHGYLHEPPAALSREQEDAVLRGRRGDPPGHRRRAAGLPLAVVGPEPAQRRAAPRPRLPLRQQHDGAGLPAVPLPPGRRDDARPPGEARLAHAARRDAGLLVARRLSRVRVRPRQGFLQEGLRPTSGVLENWLDDYRYMARELDWGVLTYTFHPEVTGRGHRMLMLERLIDGVASLGAQFVRMDEAAEEYARRSPFGD